MPRHVRIECPACQRGGLRVLPEHLGRRVSCNFCAHVFRAARPDGETAAVATATATATTVVGSGSGSRSDGSRRRMTILESEVQRVREELTTRSETDATTRQQLREKRAQLDRSKDRVRELEEQLEGAFDQIRQTAARRDELNAANAQLLDRVETLRDRADERDRLEAECAAAVDREGRLKARHDDLERAMAEADTRAREAERALADVRVRLDQDDRAALDEAERNRREADEAARRSEELIGEVHGLRNEVDRYRRDGEAAARSWQARLDADRRQFERDRDALRSDLERAVHEAEAARCRAAPIERDWVEEDEEDEKSHDLQSVDDGPGFHDDAPPTVSQEVVRPKLGASRRRWGGRVISAVSVASMVAAAVVTLGAHGVPAALVGKGQGQVSAAGRSKPGALATEERDTVTALGRLEPESEVIDVGSPAGSRIERVAVKEGETVGQGAPLVYLDSHDEMRAARDHARSQLDEAERRWQAETDSGSAAIETARLHIRQAEEVTPHSIEAQEAEVRRALAEVSKVRIDFERTNRLLRTQAVSRSEHDRDALAARQAEEGLERHRATLAEMKQDREIKLRLARSELASATSARTLAQLATQRDSLAAALRLADARVERTILRAPVDGQIIKILARAGETSGLGPVLKMGSTQSMFATAEVYETDVRHVRAGQRATVTSGAFPGVKIQGVVERVSGLVRKNDVLKIDPTSDADTRVVEVRIRLDDSRIASHYNYLQVDVAIEVADAVAARATVPVLAEGGAVR